MQMAISLSIRTNQNNPNHHLWLNNGIWWCHYTVHLPGHRSRRIRCSMRTRANVLARYRRDRLFQKLGEQAMQVSR